MIRVLAVVDRRAAGLPDGAGQVAGGVKGGSARPSSAQKALGQTVQQAGGAQHKAVLQAGRGAFAQALESEGAGAAEVDLGQLGGLLHQRIQGKLRPGQDHAAHKLLLGVDRHDGDGGICRDDRQRPGTLCQCGHRTAQQLCAQLGRVVQPQLDAAFQARPNGQEAGRAEHPQRTPIPGPLSAGTTLPRMPPSICARGCNLIQAVEQIQQVRMAYSSTVAAGLGMQPPAEAAGCRVRSRPSVMCVLPMLTVRIMVGVSSAL